MWTPRKPIRASSAFVLTVILNAELQRSKISKLTYMKNKLKRIWKFAILAALVFGSTSKSFADLSIIGIAQTLGNIIFGETTVTPSYSLYTWDYSFNWKLPTYVAYSGHYSKLRQKVRYDIPTGTYFYSSFTDFDGMGSISNNTAFMIPSIALQNYSCYLTNNVTTIAQSYTVVLTCSVASSGLAPPSGPFNICLKTVGTKLQKSCSDTNFGSTREFRKAFSAMPYGYVTGCVGFPNYSFAYPFQCWVGSVYQY
jgi:hypothetical protein